MFLAVCVYDLKSVLKPWRLSTPWKPQLRLRAFTQANQPPTPRCTSPVLRCQILNECCIHPDDRVLFFFICFALWNVNKLERLHLRTSYINTDKAACAKQANKTNSCSKFTALAFVSLGWRVTSVFFHGMHVREQIRAGKRMAIEYWLSIDCAVQKATDITFLKQIRGGFYLDTGRFIATLQRWVYLKLPCNAANKQWCSQFTWLWTL